MTISKLQADPSKQQEIDFLNEVAESIPECSYLKGLFTEHLVSWATQKIRDDWALDLFDLYNAETNRVLIMESENRKLASQLERADKERQEQIDEIKKHVAHYRELYENQCDVVRKYQKELSNVTGELNLSRSEWSEEEDRYNTCIEQLEEQVKDLKSKLYDMMVKGEK